MKRPADHLREIADLARAVSSALELDAALHEVTAAIVALRSDLRCLIRLPDPDRGGYRLAAIGGSSVAGMIPLIPFGEGLTHVVATTRRPLLVLDAPSDARGSVRAWEVARGLPVYYGVPIEAGEMLLGVLNVNFPASAPPSEEEQAIIEVFAGHAAVAIRNARLFSESEVRRRAAESLANLGRLLSQSLDPVQVAERIADGIRALLDAQSSGLYRLEPASQDLVALALSGDRGHRVLPHGTGVAGIAVRERCPITTLDLLNDPRVLLTPEIRRGIERAPFRAILSVPLLIQDRVIGALSVGDRAGRVFGNSDIGLAQAFAAHAALALENARLYAQSERERHRLTVLYDLTHRLALAREREEILSLIVDEATRLLGVEAASLRLLEGDDLVLSARTESTRAFLSRLRLRVGESLTGLVVATGQPVSVEDLTEDPRYDPRHKAAALKAGFHGFLGVPLSAEGRCLGALNVYTKSRRKFTEDEVSLLTAFANHASLAIDKDRLFRHHATIAQENARLYEEAERRRREAEVLSELARTMNASLDLGTVLARVAEGARDMCRSDMVQIAIRDPQSDAVVFRHWLGNRYQRYDTLRFEPGKGIAGQVMASGRPLRSHRVADDPRMSKDYLWLAREEGLVAMMVVPIKIADTAEGVLYVGNRSERPFTDRDETILLRLADHAAIAIHNARLYESLETRAVRLRALARLNQLVSSSLDTDRVLTEIARAAAELMAAPLVQFWIADETSEILELRAVSDERVGGDHPTKRRQFGEGVVGWVAVHRRRVEVPDIASDERFTARQWLQTHGFNSAWIIPILFQDSLLGVLSLLGRTPFRLSADDHDLLDSFVAQAGVAIRNARLYEELRRAHERLEHSQDQLVQTERLRALGEMAAGVAHDFNNLLAVIVARTELLQRRVEDPDVLRSIDAIHEAAQDGAKTVRRIQEFTRARQTRPFGAVDIVTLLREVVELARPRWKDEAQSRGVHHEVSVQGDGVSIVGSPEELREVFMNLLTNGLDAMPAGGSFTFAVSIEGDFAVVRAQDTGGGMPEEARQRVFEPFFTTKGPRGTGLGLSVSWSIISRHRGTIEVESTLGVGTTFLVRLPFGLDLVMPETDAPALPTSRSARILVIDDDPTVRTAMVELLTSEGYRAVGAGSGVEGLARSEAESLDVVLTDLSMPGMSGWDVAAAFQTKFPGMPLGLMTGWGDQLDRDRLERHQVRFVLAKPFQKNDLLRHLAQVLMT